MVDISESTRQYLNDGLEEKLAGGAPSTVKVLVEVEPSMMGDVSQRLQAIQDVTIRNGDAIGGLFIPVTLPTGSLDAVAQLEGVRMIHEDAVVSVSNFEVDGAGLPTPDSNGGFPFLSPNNDPIQEALSNQLFKALAPKDDWGEQMGFNDVVMPRFNFAQFGNPAQFAVTALDQYAGVGPGGDTFIPTGEAVDWILNGDATNRVRGSDSKAAVLDTGHTPTPESNRARTPFLASLVPGEPGADLHGHGSWCTNMMVGDSAPSTWGEVRGVAPEAEYGHFKCLNTFPGFGRTSWILKAMEAANAWGADVISMSLGGPQQGPLEQDPYATFIRSYCKENAGDEEGSIFVVAAGNSGPGDWKIGSPGVAEKAITVASWSMTDDAPAVWSSRGPQGKYYANNPEKFEEDKERFGADEFLKPDVAAPGGGRESQAKMDEEDEYLHQAEVGWMEGMFDGLKDARGGMHGTSQSTPAVAGLVLRLYEAGIIKNAAEVKEVVKEQQTVPDFPSAAENANGEEGGKNVSVGFGAIREALFDA